MTIIDRIGRTVGTSLPAAAETNPQAALAIKTPVRVCTTANIALNGLLTIDGVTVAAGDRVLVRNQTDPTQNGIYTVSTGNWTRTTDFDQLGEMVKGTQVYINEGTANGAKTSYVAASDPITPDTTSLSFSAPTAGIIEGNGLNLIGNTLSVDVGQGLEIAAGAVAVKASVLSGYGIDTYDAAAAGAEIPAGVHFVQLWGRSTALDGGQVTAVDRGLVNPGGPSRAQWQAPDGRYFQFVTDVVRPEMFGEFGRAGTGDADNSVGLIQMFNFANTFSTPKIEFTKYLWCLDAELPALTYIAEINCRLGGAQPPIFIKRYTTGGYNGVLRSTQVGLRVRGATVLGFGGTGGSGLSSILTSNSPNAGESYLENIHVSMGAFGNLSIYYDGDTNQQVGGPGYRSIYFNNHNLFGADLGCMYMTGVHHLFASGVMCQNIGGASPNAAVFTASSSSWKSDNLVFNGVLAGDVSLNNWTRGTVVAADMAGFTAGATVSDMLVYGSPTGTRSLSWSATCHIIET